MSDLYSFVNDYSEAAHPRILDVIAQTNLEQHTGYGMDEDCTRAKELLRELMDEPKADIYFISGGTQTNLIAIAGALRSYEAVVATHMGHIATLEAGAIEATGHKVITVPHCDDGKLTPEQLRELMSHHNSDYVEVPRLVYISNATELGTVYKKAELEALSQCCHELGLYLFLDGARLGAALTCPTNDLTLADVARLTDMFYIGGTKCGALFGEALVITNDALKPHMRGVIRQRGGLLAKGWLLGIQFLELFRDGLYFELADHANRMAQILRDGLTECGVHLVTCDPANQFFVHLPDEVVAQLRRSFNVYEWLQDSKTQTTLVRVTTSWATQEEQCHRFVEKMKDILAKYNSSDSVAKRAAKVEAEKLDAVKVAEKENAK